MESDLAVRQIRWHGEGDDAMIEAVSARLGAGGVPARMIHRECFFNASPQKPQV